MQKIADSIQKETTWEKPMLLLTKNGNDYNEFVDSLSETYPNETHSFTVVDAEHINFIRVDGKLEMKVQDVICDGHKSDVKLYTHLGINYCDKVLHYCVNLLEYETKPVIYIVCKADNTCSIDNIPEWVKDEFDIVRLN